MKTTITLLLLLFATRLWADPPTWDERRQLDGYFGRLGELSTTQMQERAQALEKEIKFLTVHINPVDKTAWDEGSETKHELIHLEAIAAQMRADASKPTKEELVNLRILTPMSPGVLVAERIVLPFFDFGNSRLQDIVHWINDAATRQLPTNVAFRVETEGALADKLITFKAQHISALEMLRIVSNVAEADLVFTQHGATIGQKQGAAEQHGGGYSPPATRSPKPTP